MLRILEARRSASSATPTATGSRCSSGTPTASWRSTDEGGVSVMGKDPEGRERRAHPRAQVRVPARVRTEVGVLDAETVDLSEGGVLLSSNDLPSAQEVWIDLEL